MTILLIQFVWQILIELLCLAGGAAIGLGVDFVVSVFAKTDDVKLAVLGRSQTGKTLLFKALTNKWDGVQTSDTNIEEIQSFEYIFSDGKKLFFSSTKDIGGTSSFVSEYKELIESSTHIFYFCNIYDYLNDLQVRREDNSRLDLIYDCANGKKIPSENVTLVLSYADEFQDRNSALKDFHKMLSDKKYGKYFSNNMYPINMTNKNEVDKFIDKAFKH